MAAEPALWRWLPRLAPIVPWLPLGDWPTPIGALVLDGRPLWVKREGESSARYGGNKVRTLEAWLGHARARDARRIWAIGAYGSNHAIATVLHARAAGLDAGAIVFPQPRSEWAIENAGALIATGCPLVRLRSVIEVPFAGMVIAARDPRCVVMPPGGATPLGTFGAVSAAFELVEQVARGELPPPTRIVLAIGSTCTTAGLVAGLEAARAIGAWRWPLPIVHAVRVTPWPVTSRFVVAQLAMRTLARLETLAKLRRTIGARELASRFVIDGRELGRGYGRPTPRSRRASDELAGAPRLDGVYSAKAAAALVRLHRERVEPLLLWATKSAVTLAPPSVESLAAAPRALRRWLARDQ